MQRWIGIGSTGGYGGGIAVGTGWVIVWIVSGALLGMASDGSEGDGCLGGAVGGCFLSMLVGASIYWTGVGLIFLAGTVPDWVRWLLDTIRDWF